MDQLTPTERSVAQWLTALRPAERRQLNDFINCPAICSNPALPKLLKTITDKLDAFSTGKLHSDRLYGHAFPKEPKANFERTLAKAFSDLREHIRLFAAFSQLQQDPLQTGQYVLDKLEGLQAPTELFTAEMKHLSGAIEEAPASQERLSYTYRMHYSMLLHHSTRRHTVGQEHLYAMEKAHALHGRTVQQTLSCVRASATQWLAAAPDATINEPALKDTILADLYARVQGLIETAMADITAMKDAMEQYKQHFTDLHIQEQENLLRLLINTCIQKINAGHHCFGSVLYELLNWALAQKKGFSTRWLRTDDDFLNIAIALGIAKSFDEMANFIKSHTKFLPEAIRAQAIALATSYQYFFSQSWDKCLETLELLANREPKYKYRYHVLKLCVTYKKGILTRDYDKAHTQIATYEKYFGRQEALTTPRKNSFLRLSFFVEKLSDARQNPNANLSEVCTKLINQFNDPKKSKPMASEWVYGEILALSS